MFFITTKAKAMRLRRTWGKCLRHASWMFSFMSLSLFLSGSLGAWAEPPGNLDGPETVIGMIVKANVEREPVKSLASERKASPTETGANPVEGNLTGEWEIQEEDRAYQATLDAKGNGPYTWQEGRIQTEKVVDRLWSGTWHQKGNDREGGFEVLLSEDGKTANGAWWYLRVGTHTNIPPRLEGGTYKMKRLSP